MMDVWFTSDTHFGHANIIKHSERPFASVEEMDEFMIEAWNDYVRPTDLVWHLGDFCFWDRDPEEYLPRLNGRINFCAGNHDGSDHLRTMADWVSEWDGEVVDVKYLRANGEKFWLSHYPHRAWKNSHKGSFHLYGHTHGDYSPHGRSMDVGVDTMRSYRPLHIEEIVVWLGNAKPTPHHA